MRILIAGREGQLARALIARLAGHEITALEPPALDLTSRDSISAAIAAAQPAFVINAAAYTAVDRAEDDVALARAVNATGAGWLAEAAAERGAPFVHVSTDYVFAGDKGTPYVETDPVAPLGVYGATKEEGERLVLAANPRSAVIRTAWVCSPDGVNFVKTMLRLAKERDEIRVVADQQGAPTFAVDLADAIAGMIPRLMAAELGDEAFGIFHLSGAPYTTWHGFTAEILAQAAKRGHPVPRLTPIATADYPTKAKRPSDGRMDCMKIGRVHGIQPADWRVSLGHCLDVLVGPVKENTP